MPRGWRFHGTIFRLTATSGTSRLPAEVTRSLTFGTGVYLLPLRHPVLVARQLADLSQIAPGRLTFGVGIGGEDRHEVSICGVDPATRGRRMNECLTAVRQLMTGKPVTMHNAFFVTPEQRDAKLTETFNVFQRRPKVIAAHVARFR